jgi:hypothetical protein
MARQHPRCGVDVALVIGFRTLGMGMILHAIKPISGLRTDHPITGA